MKRIGIFGSSFNPIHIGHLIISEQARIRLNLDKILFIPTANPYHKKVDLLDYDIRYEMTKKTIKDNQFFELSDIEKNLKINSYSYNIMNELIKTENANYYFIIGSDSFNNLHTWYEYEKFLQLVNLVVFKRPGYDINMETLNRYRKLSSNEIIYYDDLQIEISSTQIRNSISNNIIPRYILKDETIKFIQENNLWR
ncbi:nicotinate-nucleotide adenylyltransferase [Helcococcus kunzii]|uniref:nicotinate-nucleotide adenylyltransferase n=1 Tax=Helcococcus kunzii TaxID=40091 RepID=UPI0024AE5B3A|nr:nicotinate-nucleotide adenylyltransferase [Helcococcus kunzii]